MRTYKFFVATKQRLEQQLSVFFGSRHYVRFKTKRALAQGEPHRGELLFLARHSHIPTDFLIGRTVNGQNQFVIGFGVRQPFVNLSLYAGKSSVVE